MKKTILELAKELEFETEQEYFDYVIESKINWNSGQFAGLLQSIEIHWHNKAFYNYLIETGQEKYIVYLINF